MFRISGDPERLRELESKTTAAESEAVPIFDEFIVEELAVQQIISYDKTDGGCNGGDLPTVLDYVQNTPRRATHRGGPTNACGMEATLAFMNSGCPVVLTLGSTWGAYSVDTNEGSHCAAVIPRPSVCVEAEEDFSSNSSGIFDS